MEGVHGSIYIFLGYHGREGGGLSKRWGWGGCLLSIRGGVESIAGGGGSLSGEIQEKPPQRWGPSDIGWGEYTL
eukprot:746286-Hanusia_phi.AAC.6